MKLEPVLKFGVLGFFLFLVGSVSLANSTEAAGVASQVNQITCSTSLTQEAEAGTLSGAFQIGNRADASGGQYVYVPNDTGNISAPLASNPDFVSYCFDVQTAGNYKIEGAVSFEGIQHESDSFFVQVDDLPTRGYLWDAMVRNQFNADFVSNRRGPRPVIVNLTAGQHIIKFHLREDGTLLDKVTLVLDGVSPTATAPVATATATDTPPTNTPTAVPPTATAGPPTATPDPSACGPLMQEAEAGTLSGAFQVGNRADASGGSYIYVPDNTGNISAPLASNLDFASYCFNVPFAGDYKIEGVVSFEGTRHESDSFFVQVDDLPTRGYLWDTFKSSTFAADYVSNRRGENPVVVNLTAGQHIVKIHLREDGTLLDKLTLIPLSPPPTATVIPPTATPTDVPPTATATAVPPTATPMATETAVPPTPTPQTSAVKLIISEVVDATLPGGLPKFVELTNVGTTPIDLSTISIGNYSNGGTNLGGGDSTLLSGTLNACESYVVSYENGDSPGSGQFFDTYGFDPDNFDQGAFVNGDDVLAIFEGIATGDGSDATLIDVYGVIGTDGTGEVWEYTDGYAFRNSGIVMPNGAFTPTEWTFSGANGLETGDDVAELALILAETSPGNTADCEGVNPTPTPPPATPTSVPPTATPEPTMAPPTPTVEPGNGSVVITEIMYNPASDEDDWEWVEIYNPGPGFILLDGYVIDDNNGAVHTSANIGAFALNADQTAVLYNADDVTAADFLAAWGDVNIIPVSNWGAMGLNNGGDSLAIWDSFSSYDGDNVAQVNAIDQVVFDDSTPWPVDNNSASIHLLNFAADNSDGSEWALSFVGDAAPIFTGYMSQAAGGNSGNDVGSPGTPVMPGQSLPLSEGATDCALVGWEIVSVDTDTANTWSCSTNFSNFDVNGFGDAAPADEWLITPPLNMNAQESDTLTFENFTRFADSGQPYPQLEVVYSTDYDGGGDPTTATWTPLTGINFSPADSNTTVASGDVDLSGISGARVYFAFHYQSSGTGAGTTSNWRIDSIEFFENVVQPPSGAALIHEIQGSGAEVAITTPVSVTAIVVGDFQADSQLDGFFIQEEDVDADADPATSEGIFVYCGADSCGDFVDVAVGDLVVVTGTPVEFSGQSQIVMSTLAVVSSGNPLPTPATLDLPIATDLEAFEGMLVQTADKLFVTEHFNLGRFGETVLTSSPDRQYQGTHVAAPGATALAVAAANQLDRITLDDGQTGQNADPIVYPTGFNATNSTRAGDSLPAGFTAVLSEGFGLYRLQPTGAVTFTSDNPRPVAPASVGGDIQVASMNVLNFFTGIDGSGSICGPAGNQDCRGADSASEFTRQRDKILVALTALDADVIGLVELENDATGSLQSIVDGLNATAGLGVWDFVNTGTIGTDAIKVGFIYNTNVIATTGSFATLDSSVDLNFLDTKNRPVLAQTFTVIEAGNPSQGEAFTAAITHLKSKGSACDDVNDPNGNDGQGNCNGTRTAAAMAMANWLLLDPTGSNDPDFLILGDLNAYKMEDPITALKTAGYVDLIEQFGGNDAYSFVFGGEWGYLDYAMANGSLAAQVTGTAEWHINADEPRILDYNEEFQSPAQVAAWYNADAYRSSDHDPVVVGLELGDGTVDPPNGILPNLIISEYIEGSSNNKAIEIYNATGVDVDLGPGGYLIELHSNGSVTPTTSFLLTGVLQNGDVFVIANSSANAAIQAEADATSGVANFNGDDALVLKQGSTVIDSFGQVGTDPGSEWDGGGQNDTLRRNPNVCGGDTDPSDSFDASFEWTSFSIDTLDGLGSHTINCVPSS